MKKEKESLGEKQFANLKGEIFYPERDVKEFIKIHIEDLDWLWEIHPKTYNRIVAKFKERAGENLI